MMWPSIWRYDPPAFIDNWEKFVGEAVMLPLLIWMGWAVFARMRRALKPTTNARGGS